MNDIKLNEYLNDYGKANSPEPSRMLVDSIMAIPHQVEQNSMISWKITDWCLFLVPRLSGLTAACVLGLYMGSAGSAALAEDELAEIEADLFVTADTSIVIDADAETLLDVEEFIFVEEPAQ